MIRFTVNAVPVAQPRQRHRILPAAGRTFAQNYTPAKHPVQAFKAAVGIAFAKAYDGPPLDGPVRLIVEFVFPRPSRLRWKSRPMPREPHITRPDADNVLKALKDSLKSLAWHDDAQVYCVEVEKWIAAGDEQPRVLVEIDSDDSATKRTRRGPMTPALVSTSERSHGSTFPAMAK